MGLVQRRDDGRLTVLDPALLTAGLQVVELGVPPEQLIAAQSALDQHVREIAPSSVASRALSPAVADDGADDQGDQRRGRHEEAHGAEDAEAVHGDGAGHLST